MPVRYPFAAVLFDLDGVLIDTTDLHYRVWDEFARGRGFVPTKEQLLATNERRADETIRLWLGSGLSDQQVAAITAEREAYCYRLLEMEDVPAVPGAVEFVRALMKASVPIAVVTSAIRENARLSLSRIELNGVFRAIVTAADVKYGKPDPEPYLKAADRLGVAAADCLVIEDSVSGIRAAKAAGAKCLALATTFPKESLAAELPDWVAYGFGDIPSFIHPGGAVPLPVEADFADPRSQDLDERCTVRMFLGKTPEKAEAMFREHFLYHQEHLTYMRAPAFRFYVIPAIKYLLSEDANGDSDAASTFCYVLESRL
jgi:beta-phosphoglucomutase